MAGENRLVECLRRCCTAGLDIRIFDAHQPDAAAIRAFAAGHPEVAREAEQLAIQVSLNSLSGRWLREQYSDEWTLPSKVGSTALAIELSDARATVMHFLGSHRGKRFRDMIPAGTKATVFYRLDHHIGVRLGQDWLFLVDRARDTVVEVRQLAPNGEVMTSWNEANFALPRDLPQESDPDEW
jgi:hypothetical protein